MKSKSLLLSVFSLLLMGSTCFGWGKFGHQVVAQIAQDRLSDKTKDKVKTILGQSKLNMPAVSVWADKDIFLDKKTAHWHYINLPISENKPDIEKYCAFGDCIVNQIIKDEAILRGSIPGDKKEALKYLIHFVGDIHQPLHCANDNDRGGNDKPVTFKGKKMNLHELWDNVISKDGRGDYKKEAKKFEIRKGKAGLDVEEWARVSYEYAKYIIYPAYKPDYLYIEWVKVSPDYKTVFLHDDEYEKAMRPIALRQIGLAGWRLAAVLEDCLK